MLITTKYYNKKNIILADKVMTIDGSMSIDYLGAKTTVRDAYHMARNRSAKSVEGLQQQLIETENPQEIEKLLAKADTAMIECVQELADALCISQAGFPVFELEEKSGMLKAVIYNYIHRDGNSLDFDEKHDVPIMIVKAVY